MKRGHRGDDPALPLRKLYSSRSGNRYLSWRGPVDYDGPEEALWEMEIDLDEFAAGRRGSE